MKMMASETYAKYSAILRRLRARGVRLGFLEMGAAADLAMAMEDEDQDEVERLAARLEVDLEALP